MPRDKTRISEIGSKRFILTYGPVTRAFITLIFGSKKPFISIESPQSVDLHMNALSSTLLKFDTHINDSANL